MTRLLIMGPPGAGKGTQAELLAARRDIPWISTGDIFRQNMRDGTPLGLEAKRYVDAGEYVPDDVTSAMLRDRLGQADAGAGFLLDGYPRTLAQVDTLDEMLAASCTGLDRVVELAVDREEIVRRLVGRAGEQGRTDDTADVVRRRLDVYAEQTAPLLAVYERRGLLTRVDGTGSVDQVAGRIDRALADGR